jgi:hypothetical protein
MALVAYTQRLLHKWRLPLLETQTITIGTANLMLLPFVHSPLTRGVQQAQWLIHEFLDCDVLVLTEMFAPLPRRLLQLLLRSMWPYSAGPYPELRFGGVSSGVVIMSKYPVDNVAYATFSATTTGSSDALAAKGVLGCTVRPTHLSTPVLIVGTHLQSGTSALDARTRTAQLAAVRRFIGDSFGHLDAVSQAFVVGDFNFDMRDAAVHKLCLSHMFRPHHAGITFDTDNNKIARARAEPGDVPAAFDGCLVDVSRTSARCHGGTTVVSRVVLPVWRGKEVTDHSAVRFTCCWMQQME